MLYCEFTASSILSSDSFLSAYFTKLNLKSFGYNFHLKDKNKMKTLRPTIVASFVSAALGAVTTGAAAHTTAQLATPAKRYSDGL